MSNPFRMHPTERFLVHRSGMIVSLRGESRGWRERIVGAPSGIGYLVVACAGNKLRQVHTIVLEAFVGPAPRGMVCRHMDGDGMNNHIENLRWGTRVENEADKVRHGRSNRGERHGMSKLTPAAVLTIRSRAVSETHKAIAADYGISRAQVGSVVSRKAWRHV